jgi:hypothetical protein
MIARTVYGLSHQALEFCEESSLKAVLMIHQLGRQKFTV